MGHIVQLGSVQELDASYPSGGHRSQTVKDKGEVHLVDLDTCYCRLAALDLMGFANIDSFADLRKRFVQQIVPVLEPELVLLVLAVYLVPQPVVVPAHQELVTWRLQMI